MDTWWYDRIKWYYDAGCYVCDPKHDMYVGKFVKHGKITPKQYKEITTKEYPKNEASA